jgi:hypothetical protein
MGALYLKEYNMSLSTRITIDPQICHGKPCIRGLRYPVENILELLSAGMEIEDILASSRRFGKSRYFSGTHFCYSFSTS